MQYDKKTALFRDILLSHQEEKERLLAQAFIPREGLARAQAALENPLISVIIGPRRAGKSTFARHLLKDKDFAYVNFDDERFGRDLDTTELMKAIHSLYGKVDFLFFDEIQNLPRFELFVNRLHREGYRLVITGSNAQLLSQELATHLTGRHQIHQVLPFSFAEYRQHQAISPNEGLMLNDLTHFMTTGGYPEVILHKLDGSSYLKTLYESILFKDVSKRFRIRYPQQLADLGHFLMSHGAREMSVSSLTRLLHFRSAHTAEQYLHYLIEAYLVFLVPRFSHSLKSQIKSPKKLYAYDTGMSHAVRFDRSPDIGYTLENIVAIELKRRHANLYTYKTVHGREVDFAIKGGHSITSLIQVAYDLSGPKTKDREFAALVDAAKELHCDDLQILTWSERDETSYKGYRIRLLPIWEWLLTSSVV